MPFVTDGIGLWEMGELPVRAGIIVAEANAKLSTSNVHTGSYCLNCDYGDLFYQMLPIARSDLSGTIWVRPTGSAQIRFYISDALTCSLRWDGTYWDAYVNDSKVADGTIATPGGAYQRVSWHIIVSNTGTIDTKIDGITDIEYSGDTQPGAGTDIDEIGLYGSGANYFDDLVWGTGGWPGDRRVIFLAPTSDATKGWTASTGADNYACVDERPPSDTDYVSCTADQIDEYGCADFAGTGKIVGSVTVIARAKKSDGGSDDKITLGLGDGTNTADGSAVSVLTSYQHYWYTKSTAPDGGAWTDTDVDNLELRLLGDIA